MDEVKTLTTRDILPKKPSKLLALALKDFIALENNRDYRFNIRLWHKYVREGNTCEIGLSGCVIANTLKIAPHKSVTPYSFKSDTLQSKLIGLFELRRLNLNRAFIHLDADNFSPKFDKLESELFLLIKKYGSEETIKRAWGYARLIERVIKPFYGEYVGLLKKGGF